MRRGIPNPIALKPRNVVSLVMDGIDKFNVERFHNNGAKEFIGETDI